MKLLKKLSNSKLVRAIYYRISFGNKYVFLRDNIKLKVKNTLVKYDEYNEDLSSYIKLRDIQEGDYVIDAGGYQGYISMYASKKVGPSGKVFTFEPIKWNYNLIKKHLKLNKINNVYPINMGLFDKETTIYFDAKGGSSSFSKTGGTAVKVTTIDSFLKRNKINPKKIKFIKMDIEGAEIEALQGAENLIKNGDAFWAIASYHIVNGKTTSGFIEKFFKKYKYKVITDDKVHMLTTYAYKK